ncbi:hypothetical protein [Campylobacter showae]|jgi:hypothetical protein|uniref:hypothetical protein n=1 Tax=Campylobacter showae TaxID=204 RepID=UPI0028D69278|nr:hypothetical protein [Campylobacter showae]
MGSSFKISYKECISISTANIHSKKLKETNKTVYRLNNDEHKEKLIKDSIINLYALALKQKEFYDFKDYETNDYEKLKSIAYNPLLDTKKKGYGREKKIADQVKNTLGLECAQDPHKYLINTFYIKKYISNNRSNTRSEDRHLKNLFNDLFERLTLLSIENKSSQPQAINDKNCYIISPCKVLENHVRNIKSFKIDEYEEYRLFQDSAFIVLTSLKASYTWEIITIKDLLKKEAALKQEQMQKEPATSSPMVLYLYTPNEVGNIKFDYFIKNVAAIIAYKGGVTLVDNDYRTVDLKDIGMEIFELDIFKDRWISFRYEDSLVIFSRKYPRFGKFDETTDNIDAVRAGRKIYGKETFARIVNTCLSGSLDIDKSLRLIERSSLLLSNDFKDALGGEFKKSLSYKYAKQEQNDLNEAWLKSDLKFLYQASNPWCNKTLSREDVALLLLREEIGISLSEFVKKYKNSDTFKYTFIRSSLK